MGEKRGLKALELWCRRVTDGYRDVHVSDMSSSWRDGLAFCALIHHFRPDLIDFETLRKGDILRNNRLAFTVAETQLGIPALLDAEDMLAFQEPDRLSVATYVSQFYQYFEGSLSARRRAAAAAASSLKRTAATSSPASAPLSIGPPTKIPGVADSCNVCKQRVFLLERLMVDGRLYHRTCFRCSRCSAILNPGAYNECDNAPGTYECTVCPRDERLESGLQESSTPRQPERATRIALPKPQIPEKKLELSESFRAARRLFESSMVHGSPQTSPKPLRKNDFASSLSPKPTPEAIEPSAVSSPENGADKSDAGSVRKLGAEVPGRLSDVESSEGPTADPPARPSELTYVVHGSDESEREERPPDVSHGPAKLTEPHPRSKLSEGSSKTGNTVSLERHDVSAEMSDLKPVEGRERSEKSVLISSKSPSRPDSLPPSNKFRVSAPLLRSAETPARSPERPPDSKPSDAATKTISALDSKERQSEGVAKWNAIKHPELPAFLRQRDEAKRSTVQENIERFSLAASVEVENLLPTARRSLGEHRSGSSTQAKESSVLSRLSLFKADATTDGALPLRKSEEKPEREELSSPSKISPLDLPVIRPAVPPAETVPKPAPRCRLPKQTSSDEPSPAGTDKEIVANASDLGTSTVVPGTPEEEEDKPPDEEPPPPPDSLPPPTLNEDAVPVPAARSSTTPQKAPENKEVKVVIEDTTGNAKSVKDLLSYPSTLNPFGDPEDEGESEEENYPESLNPFGDSGDEDEAVSVVPSRRMSDYDDSLNPFSEDDDPALSSTRGGSSRKKAPPPPPPLQDSGTSTPASLRSVDTSPVVQRSPMGQRPSPRPRKKPAPPPPSLTSTPNSTPDSKSGLKAASTPDWRADPKPESLKSEKNERNTSIQMQSELGESENEPTAQKHTFGYWKRKKRPAPSVPVPVRREIKRIPANEIQQEMEGIMKKQEELEQQGREIEMQIRDRNGKYSTGQMATMGHSELDPSLEEEEMIMQLFELVNEKNSLFRRQAELMYIKRSQRLEEEQVELEYQIRCIMTKPPSQKTEEDAAREEELLQRLLEVVEQRNEIVESQEMDRRRVAQEDWSIQEQMAQKQSEMKEKMSPSATPGKKKEKKQKKHKKGEKKEDSKVTEEEKRKSLRKLIKQKLVLAK